MAKKLSLMDATMLLTESTESPKHVAALQIFELPKDHHSNYIRDLLEGFLATEVGPPFNYILKPALVGLPSWEELDELDLEYHIRHSALPKPGTLQDLMLLVSRLHSRLLDRTRPLWEFHVIEGLKDRRFALYTKMHHAFIDGAGAVMRMEAALSKSPEDTRIRGLWQPLERSKGKRREPPPRPEGRLASAVALLTSQAKTAPELAKTLAQIGLQQAGLYERRSPAPFMAPRTPLNVPVSAARRVAGTTLLLNRVKAVSKMADVTVNDMLLAVVDGALNHYLRKHDALPDSSLIAEVPMNIRREGDTRSGNQIAVQLVTLGSPNAKPLVRLKEISASATEVKKYARSLSAEALNTLTILPQGFAELLGKLNLSQELPPIANVLVSNVPGPREPLYLTGAPMVACYPISLLPPGLSLNITIHTYLNAMDLGLLADREALPDLDVLAGYLGDAFEELEAAALAQHKTARSPKEAPRTTAQSEAEAIPEQAAGAQSSEESAPGSKETQTSP